MANCLILFIFSMEFSFLPVQANYGFTLDKKKIANLSIGEFSINLRNIQFGIFLYDVDDFYTNMKYGKIYYPYSPDSLELVVRYRKIYSQWVFTTEIFPIKKLPLSLKFKGSWWAKERIENWIEAEIIQKDPYVFYEYAVYELQPSSYYKISLSFEPFHILNSKLFAEAGYRYINYPEIAIKRIKTSFSQFYFSTGTKLLQKRSSDNFSWEVSFATGIDAASIGIFALGNVYYDKYQQKTWQMATIGTLGVISGAASGYLQHYLKSKWLRPEDKLSKKFFKKAGAGIIAGLLFETAMIGGYCYVSKDWPHNGDYMIRDFAYWMLVKIGCLGHLCTSIIF